MFYSIWFLILNRKGYSREEDKKILKYIVQTNRYEEVRGKSLWIHIQDHVLDGESHDAIFKVLYFFIHRVLTVFRIRPFMGVGQESFSENNSQRSGQLRLQQSDPEEVSGWSRCSK